MEKKIICEVCGGDKWILKTNTITKSGGIPEIMECEKCNNVFPIPKDK